MFDLSEFAQTLSGLMFENGNLNAKTLAEKLNVAAPTITRYLRAERTPTVENLVKIADYFHRSVDFLLGSEGEDASLTFKKCPPFSEQIVFLAEHFKRSFTQFYHDAGIPESSFFEWKNASSFPTIESIIKIADCYDCRIDFVLGREN